METIIIDLNNLPQWLTRNAENRLELNGKFLNEDEIYCAHIATLKLQERFVSQYEEFRLKKCAKIMAYLAAVVADIELPNPYRKYDA